MFTAYRRWRERRILRTQSIPEGLWRESLESLPFLAIYTDEELARVREKVVLFLNAKNMLIANEAMWRGSVDEASMHVREVMKRAMAHGATAIIIVHNHPSGDPTPSQADVKLTRELVEAGRHMKVTVHDHVIVGLQGQSSLRARGRALTYRADAFLGPVLIDVHSAIGPFGTGPALDLFDPAARDGLDPHAILRFRRSFGSA